jgi:hypothetical protein
VYIPTQGFRHAVALLVTKSSRAIPAGATPETVAAEVMRLARDLVALADDMHAKPESAEWMITEYNRALSQLPHTFDRDAARASAAAILSQVTSRRHIVESRDLFLVYLAEDRLPVAAPLAVELAKRRITVAIADYEIATREQFAEAIEHGLQHHQAGAVLWTDAWMKWGRVRPDFSETERLRALRQFDGPAIAEVADWVRRLKAQGIAK